MNIENLKKWIAVLERVKERGDGFNMSNWNQAESLDGETTQSEEALHTCGSAACAGGWLAVSPEWIDDGGRAGASGAPCMADDGPTRSVAKWLDVPIDTAETIMFVNDDLGEFLYDKAVEEVEVDDVLSVLYKMRDTGKCPTQPEQPDLLVWE